MQCLCGRIPHRSHPKSLKNRARALGCSKERAPLTFPCNLFQAFQERRFLETAPLQPFLVTAQQVKVISRLCKAQRAPPTEDETAEESGVQPIRGRQLCIEDGNAIWKSVSRCAAESVCPMGGTGRRAKALPNCGKERMRFGSVT